jgi:hypothetical protein
VTPLPAQTAQFEFAIAWSGQDDAGGSGVASFDVYVSDNNGPWTLWQNAVANLSALFTGQFGRTYAFYSMARDQVGNQESPPAGLALVSVLWDSGVCSRAGNVLSWQIGELAVGRHSALTVTATTDTEGSLTNAIVFGGSPPRLRTRVGVENRQEVGLEWPRENDDRK